MKEVVVQKSPFCKTRHKSWDALEELSNTVKETKSDLLEKEKESE